MVHLQSRLALAARTGEPNRLPFNIELCSPEMGELAFRRAWAAQPNASPRDGWLSNGAKQRLSWQRLRDKSDRENGNKLKNEPPGEKQICIVGEK